MSESNHIDINSLHNTVLRETENDSLLEIKPNFYRNLSDFIGNLRKQEFEGVENKIKETMIEMATELTSLLIHIRLEKISSSNDYDIGYLLDEEKFIESGEIDINLENYPKKKWPEGSEFRGFLYPPKWKRGTAIVDDFEFFWVIQYEVDAHLKIFFTATDIWKNNKILGSGIKSFRYKCRKLLIHRENRLCSTHPHNYYLEILIDTGIIGFILFMVMFYISLINKFFYFKNKKNRDLYYIFLMISLCIILEIFPLRSSGSFFSSVNSAYIFFLIGIFGGLREKFNN